jgi:hypothetical protein
LIFSRPIFFEVLFKGLNYEGMNLEMEKNVNFNTIYLFFEKSLDLDSKNGL